MQPAIDSVLDRIRHFASLSPAAEIGGIARRRGEEIEIVQIANAALDTKIFWSPDPIEYAEIDCHEIAFFWHTHINGCAEFSPDDIRAIWSSRKPNLLYNLPLCQWDWFDPANPRLIGNIWRAGLSDCYCAIRKFYTQKLDIYLPDPEADCHNWKDPNWDLMRQRLPEKFIKVSSGNLKPYDLLLYKGTRGPNPAHLAMALPLSGGLGIYHHPYGRLSRIEELPPADLIDSIWRLRCHYQIPRNYNYDSLGYWVSDGEDLMWYDPIDSEIASHISAQTTMILHQQLSTSIGQALDFR